MLLWYLEVAAGDAGTTGANNIKMTFNSGALESNRTTDSTTILPSYSALALF
jgi:hypothetical protein